MLNTDNDLEGLLRAEAFRLLLATGDPVAQEDLARAIGRPLDQTDECLVRLSSVGRIRTDEAGRVVGSAGLSVVPDRHEIEIHGRRFWTWCAYDILGIFGALQATGTARSVSPSSGTTIELTFVAGRPAAKNVVLFRPGAELAAGCDNVYEEWCPNSNLFEDEARAGQWAAVHRVDGVVLGLAEAAGQAANEWLPLAQGLTI